MIMNPGIYLHTPQTNKQLNKYSKVTNDDIQDIYVNLASSKVNVHIIEQVFYWNMEENERFGKYLSEHFPYSQDSKFIIFTLNEPRLLDNCLIVHYLINNLKIKPANIIFISSAQQNEKQKLAQLGVHIITMSKLGISFCSIAEQVITNKLEDTEKVFNTTDTKLFSCLTKRLTPQRFVITSLLHKEFSPQEYEMSAAGESEQSLINSSITNHCVRESVLAGGNIDFYKKLPLVFDTYPIDYQNNTHYRMRHDKLKKCLFDIINESIGHNYPLNFPIDNLDNFNHATEKSFKHLYNYQIPIFNCRPEYIDYFKSTFNTDLFEDIVPMDRIYSKNTHHERAIEIVSFLKQFKETSTLTKKDIKDRLIENYKSIYRIFTEASIEYKLNINKVRDLVIYT